LRNHHKERAEGPWLILAYNGNPTIRLDVRKLDTLNAEGGELVITISDIKFALQISGGQRVAATLAEDLLPYTRLSPITRDDIYEDAKSRLRNEGMKGGVEPALYFGEHLVLASDSVLYIGNFKCTIEDVERYASVGASLPLPDGRLQAGLAKIVVLDRKRGEDLTRLAERVAAFEATRS